MDDSRQTGQVEPGGSNRDASESVECKYDAGLDCRDRQI